MPTFSSNGSEHEQTVVIVEDDRALLNALSFAFEVEGLRVIGCACAEELLATPALPLHGCLVLDYRLPGMDGLRLLDQLRGRGCDLPALIITTATPALVNLLEGSGTALVEKPLLSGELLEQVRALMAPADALTGHRSLSN